MVCCCSAAGWLPLPATYPLPSLLQTKSWPPLLQIKAYVEVHMEQGPRLQAAGRALGPVAAISGQSRLQAEIVGEQVSAGRAGLTLELGVYRRVSQVCGRENAQRRSGWHRGGCTSSGRQAGMLVCTPAGVAVP